MHFVVVQITINSQYVPRCEEAVFGISTKSHDDATHQVQYARLR